MIVGEASMNKNIFRSILAASSLLVFTLSTNIASAQENSPTFKISLFDVEGFTISKTINLDVDFAAENKGLEILAPFKISIPQQTGITPLYDVGNGTNDEILKISFATGDRETPMEERKLVENIRFVSMWLPLGDQAERLDNLANLVKNHIFVAATDGYEEIQYIGAKSSTLGDLVVIEAVGQYVDPSIGLMLLHVIGYPNPDDANSIFAVSSIVADMFEFSTFDDLTLTGGGRTLASFEYLNK